MAEQHKKSKYREKPFDQIVKDADQDMNAPIPVYQFNGRTFREHQNKPYEPKK